MKILRFKVVIECPECWNKIQDSCYRCNGSGEVEVEMGMDEVMFQLAGQLRHYDYIHDHPRKED